MYRIGMTVATLITFASQGVSLIAQNQPVPSLQELLLTQYKVTTTGSDADGFRIIEPGTVLVIKKEGIIATPHASPHGIAFKLPNTCNNSFKNGALTTPKACAKTSVGSKFLPAGEKMYITKFDVNTKSNKITLNLVECDTCNGVTGRSSMKATVIFDFNDQFLQKAEPGQVTDVINQVLEPQRSALLTMPTRLTAPSRDDTKADASYDAGAGGAPGRAAHETGASR